MFVIVLESLFNSINLLGPYLTVLVVNSDVNFRTSLNMLAKLGGLAMHLQQADHALLT